MREWEEGPAEPRLGFATGGQPPRLETGIGPAGTFAPRSPDLAQEASPKNLPPFPRDPEMKACSGSFAKAFESGGLAPKNTQRSFKILRLKPGANLRG